jgi:hypothetical protein
MNPPSLNNDAVAPENLSLTAEMIPPTVFSGSPLTANQLTLNATIPVPTLVVKETAPQLTGTATMIPPSLIGGPRVVPSPAVFSLTGGMPVVGNGASTIVTPSAATTWALTGGTPVISTSTVAAATFDAVAATPYSTATSATSLNGSFIMNATGGSAVIVQVATVGNTAGAAATWTRTATYGGIPMTSLGVVDANGQNFGWIEFFVLKNVPGGPQTVHVSATGGGATLRAAEATAVSYTGVINFGTPVVNSGGTFTAMTSGNVTIAARQMVVQAFLAIRATNTNESISSYNGTVRYGPASFASVSSSMAVVMGDAGPGTTNFTASAPSPRWASIAVPLTQ